MANDGLKHVVHRRVHLERSQPEHRKRKVGQFLEKKADYKKRAERYHVREKLIKELAAKTRFRNEDEFNFKMVHAKIGAEGQVVLESEEAARRRRLSKAQRVRDELRAIDRNVFVVNHKQNVLNRRLDRTISANVDLLTAARGRSTCSSSPTNAKSAGSSAHVLYEDSDAESGPGPSTSTDASSSNSKTSKKAHATTAAARAEQLFELSDMFDDKRQLDGLRAKLEDTRNLRVAEFRKRQVKRVRGGSRRVHEYPPERLK